MTEQKKFPGITKLATNFVSSMTKFAASGFDMVDEREAAIRISICENCEELEPEAFRCYACGCYLKQVPITGIPGKAYLSTESCTLGKW